MEQEIRFCTTSDGVRIAYASLGDGPPLIVVPGWVSHQEIIWETPFWRPMVAALGEHFKIVSYDKRGTGLSDRSVSDYSVEARLRDLEAVVESLKARRIALFGISEGGPVAISYAAAHPRSVTALLLFGTFAQGPRLTANDKQRETIDALIALARAEWGLGSQTLSNVFMPGAAPDEVELFTNLQRAGATREDAAAMLQANVETDVSDRLSKIRAPTLVAHVRGDRAIPFELGRRLASSVRNARFLALDGERHLGAETGQQVFLEAAKEFLLAHYSPPERTAQRAGTPSDFATVLFTDVEGSTALTQRLGDERAREVLRAHERIVREALAAHSGAEVKAMGDGFMASFGSATRALQCAIAIQRGFEEHNTAEEEPVRVRVGLNAGEPIAEDDDLFGTAVILAARIAAKAQGGEILASNVVRELTAGKGFLFADRGETELRGFEDPVKLFEVRWRE